MTRQREARAGNTGNGSGTNKHHPHDSAPPTKRRCPSCRVLLPSGAFVPLAHDRTRLGIAARECPRCGHRGLLVAFKREGGGR